MCDSILKLDVVIHEHDIENGVKEVLSHLKPTWARKDVVLKAFTDGVTNKLFGCYLSNDPTDVILVRIYGKKTELFIDRKAEIDNMQLLHAVGCSSQLYAVFKNGLAYEYLPGNALNSEDLRDETLAKLIADRFAKLHSIVPVENGDTRPGLFEMINRFIKLVPVSFPEAARDKKYRAHIPGIMWLEEEVKNLEEHIAKLGCPIVFCHNDLLSRNIIHDKEQGVVHFIDFEYGGYNYQAFDIADHFCEYAGLSKVDYNRYPSERYQKKWLRYYLQQWFKRAGRSPDDVTDAVVQRLYVQVCKCVLAAHMLWGMWAFVQAINSTLKFGYLEYGILRIEEYKKRKDVFLAMEME